MLVITWRAGIDWRYRRCTLICLFCMLACLYIIIVFCCFACACARVFNLFISVYSCNNDFLSQFVCLVSKFFDIADFPIFVCPFFRVSLPCHSAVYCHCFLIFIVVPFADVFHFVHLISNSFLLDCFSLELFLTAVIQFTEQHAVCTTLFIRGTPQCLLVEPHSHEFHLP